MAKVASCPDCGPAAVSHRAARWSVIIDRLLTPVARPVEAVRRTIARPLAALRLERAAPAVVRGLVGLGLARVIPLPDDGTSLRARAFWEEARRRGITMYEVCLKNGRRDLFVAEFRGAVCAFDGLPRPHGEPSKALEWMDDKVAMRERFAAAGLPVARGAVCRTAAEALATFRHLRPPLIVKPNLGSRSRHTTTHLADERTFLAAFAKAQQLSPWVVVEEELRGMVHRGTVIGGRLVGVCRREPPHVVGDGERSVRELVEAENKNPARRGPIFHSIALDAEATSELRRQGLAEQSVPAAGQLVTLNPKVSRAYGATTTDVTDQTHPENVALFGRIGALLQDPLVGIDFIVEDSSRSWRAQERCGVIELNGLPFLDLHHYPYRGQPRNAAGALWDLIFPDSKSA